MSSSGKTLIIDFNDSFTYNIFELLRKIGCSDFHVQPVASLDAGHFNIPDRLILSPGPGVPDDYPEVYRLLARLLQQEKTIPVLGICLGHQLLCRFFGAELYNLEHPVHGQPCHIRRINQISRSFGQLLFRGMPDEFTVGLYHSWAVSKPLPAGLHMTAESDAGVIMAAAHDQYPCMGVQFHPESFISQYGDLLLTNFLEMM